jgi:peptidoglycan-N-acetylglucosamine deacetylase
MRRIAFLILAAGAGSVVLPVSATAQNVCFAPDQMTARAGERLPVKGNATFNEPTTDRTLAPFKPIPANLRGSIRRVTLPPGKKLIALTLDLCEQPNEVAGYDGAIFDYLRAEGVKATLFAGGKWMRSHPERMAQLMTDPLFEMANHSEAHRNLRLLDGTALSQEIAGPQRAYEWARDGLASDHCKAAAKPRMDLFRYPYGACDQESLDAVNDAGLLAIQWDVSTGDPTPAQLAPAIAAEMMRAKPGSILIAHANGRGHHTAEALPLAIPQLKAQGFEFVTVSELLAAGQPEITQTCYNNKPGDTDKYDHPRVPKKPEIAIPDVKPEAAAPDVKPESKTDDGVPAPFSLPF